MPKLVKNGILQIPVYHGTSTLFLSSIEEHGLGAVDPIRDTGWPAFLSDLLKAGNEALGEDSEWLSCNYVIRWMVDQTSFSRSSNFQHGHTYLTPSRNSALRYASRNRLGSEFMSQAERVFRMIEERNSSVLERRGLLEHPLATTFAAQPRPVILRIDSIEMDYLASEDGGPTEDVVVSLAPMAEFLNMVGVTINDNFRLLRPLAPGRPSVSYVTEEKAASVPW